MAAIDATSSALAARGERERQLRNRELVRFWLYFVLPTVGVRLEAMTVAIAGIAMNYGAYGAEIVRGALKCVPAGQVDAARALGVRDLDILRHVVAPQAATVFVRPWGNLMIQLLKATSLVSLITLADLTYRAYQLHQLTMKTFPIFGAVLVIYFLMAQVIALAEAACSREWTKTHAGGANRGRCRAARSGNRAFRNRADAAPESAFSM